jgi:HPt (histidine-containing phosphotransfer) domain-containing protein
VTPTRKYTLLQAHSIDLEQDEMNQMVESPAREELTVCVDADIADLVPGFLENRRRDVQALRTAMEEGDFAAIGFIGHTLKGAGAGYGFETISEIGRTLELAGKQREQETTRVAIERLGRYLDVVKVEVLPD